MCSLSPMCSSNAVPFKGQKYSVLKKQAVSSGRPFEDPEFPRNEQSLFLESGLSRSAGIEWKRPGEICSDPRLFTEGVSRHDLIQGELGNCWLVAACSCLALEKSIWSQVIVDGSEQDWVAGKDHPGIFHFRFWRYGVWVDVVIDDYLPTRSNRLIYVHSPEHNEFWSALLEKAYAKLFGCYETMDGGELSEALADFSGGVSETIELANTDEAHSDQFHDWLLRASNNRSLMCAAINAESASDMEQPTEFGLVKGHAYSVTAIRRVALEGTGLFNLFNREKLAMIRLRNPWGQSEWTGAFSDRDVEWQKVEESDRAKIGLTFDNDGEFWMTFDDFCKHFDYLSICHRINTSIASLHKRWHDSMFHGAWLKPYRAGGCSNNLDTFFYNPQYVFTVTEDSDEIMFELSQKTNRQDKVSIGFTVLKVENNREYRVHTMHPKICSPVFRNSRSIFWHGTFRSGRYVLIACTFEPSLEEEFLLRCFAGHDIHMKELKLDKPSRPCCCFACLRCLPLCRYPQYATSINVVNAEGLHREDRSADVNAYCIVSCERKKVQTSVVMNSSQPEWNTAAVFYRRTPTDKPVTLEVWHHNTVGIDECLGVVTYDKTDETSATSDVLQLPLVPKYSSRDQSATNEYSGSITVELTNRRKLAAV